LTEAKLLALNQAKTSIHNNAVNYEQNNLTSSDMQTYNKHKSSRNNHGVHFQSLFYKDPSFQPTKLSELNDQISLKLDLTTKRKKSNKHEEATRAAEIKASSTNKRKINESTNDTNSNSNRTLDFQEKSNEHGDIKINELALSEEDTTGDDGEDDEMPIEELGQYYLNRHSNIRRHTIGTDAENNTNTNVNSVNNIIKSTEFFYLINGGNVNNEQDDNNSDNDDENEEEQPKQKRLSPFNQSNLALNKNTASSFNDVKNLNDPNQSVSFQLNNNPLFKEEISGSKYLSTPNRSPQSQMQKKVQYQLPVNHSSHHHSKHHRHSNYHGVKPQRNKNRYFLWSIFILKSSMFKFIFKNRY